MLSQYLGFSYYRTRDLCPDVYSVCAQEDSVAQRLQELSSDVGVTGNVCRETNPEEDSHVVESSILQIEQVCAVEEEKFQELKFSHGYALDNNKQILVVTQCHLAYHPPFGYVSRVRITFQEDGSYKVHILMRELENGQPEWIMRHLQTLSFDINIVYCGSVKDLFPFDFINTPCHSTPSFCPSLLSIGYSP